MPCGMGWEGCMVQSAHVALCLLVQQPGIARQWALHWSITLVFVLCCRPMLRNVLVTSTGDNALWLCRLAPNRHNCPPTQTRTTIQQGLALRVRREGVQRRVPAWQHASGSACRWGQSGSHDRYWMASVPRLWDSCAVFGAECEAAGVPSAPLTDRTSAMQCGELCVI